MNNSRLTDWQRRVALDIAQAFPLEQEKQMANEQQQAKHTAGRHSVMAARIGFLFRKPDAFRVEISVEKDRSRWAVRSDCNGFATFRRGFKTKGAAVIAAGDLAAETTRLNESARAAIAKAGSTE